MGPANSRAMLGWWLVQSVAPRNSFDMSDAIRVTIHKGLEGDTLELMVKPEMPFKFIEELLR